MDIDAALQHIADERARDPLRPVTVIAPSHAAALHLRRRLAALTPFASVRFEPLPRIAELLGAGSLAAAGRTPLARPIGDYVAEQVARDSAGTLGAIKDLPGYARVLRTMFRRLRRGGITGTVQMEHPAHPHMREILRLYQAFRDLTSRFYDDQDLLDAAAEAVRDGDRSVLADLGELFLVPPGAQTAASDRLMEALRAAAPCTLLDEPAGDYDTDLLLAPDVASEAREVARRVVDALADGVALHEIGVLHGADPAYKKALPEAMRLADVPCAQMPGTPLIELAAGRAVLALCALPAEDYARPAVFTALELATPRRLPGPGDESVYPRVTAWDRLSREAGVTRSLDGWRRALTASEREHEDRLANTADPPGERQRRGIEAAIEEARGLRGVIDALASRLDPLAEPQLAAEFIETLKAVAEEYISSDAQGFDDVMQEIDQLGTVAAVGGTFTLPQFTRALRANLEQAYTRERNIGDGVLVADYRAAAGMRFQRVILCGAREGVFPASPGQDAIVPDAVWSELRVRFPFIEDAAARSERALAAAEAALLTARGGRLTWCAPMFESNGTRELYPSPLMVRAASAHDPSIQAGSQLRAPTQVRAHARVGAHTQAAWLRRASSPLVMRLTGATIDAGEAGLRDVIDRRRSDTALPTSHPRHAAVTMARARAGDAFTAWDGNVGPGTDEPWLAAGAMVSPTGLEVYAQCGFRYFNRSVLRLREIEEPEERETMEAHTRGSIAHRTLEAFFREQRERGRPAYGERWTDDDRDRLLELLDIQLDDAGERGLLGMEIFAGHQRRSLRADLTEFLRQDEAFRLENGAAPWRLEEPLPQTTIAGLTMRGFVDRIDRSEDGERAWVIDYKTGSTYAYKDMRDDKPLVGGTKLQLPSYLLAVPGVPQAKAFYWFISQAGGFEKRHYTATPEMDARFADTVAAISEGIREGTFPAVPGTFEEYRGRFENCGFCEFDRICSRRREEAFGAKSEDAAMDGWSRVQRIADAT